MARLSVNINKFATLRNARGANNPDILKVASDCERFGAQGITVHPRPDERHITKKDVYRLREVVTTEFNIEGYPDDRFMQIASHVKPDQATLVPDKPEALTSNAGWDTIAERAFLRSVIDRLRAQGIRVSLFVAPDDKMVEGAAETGADRIELYTEPYAMHYPYDKTAAVAPYKAAAAKAHRLGLGINAGHDLDLYNLGFLIAEIPLIEEVSIGHALVCDAIYLGLENTIQMYLNRAQSRGRQIGLSD